MASVPVAEHSSRSIWTLIGVESGCLLGSEISRFGISVWIYTSTHSVGAFSALLLANILPGMLSRPIAGAYVDRKSRKAVMIGAALVTLVGTAIVLSGALLGELSMPLVIAGASLASIGESFQWPALAATVPLMTTDDELPKYNGFLESGRAIGRFAGPAVGGFLFALVGVTGLVTIELVTFVLATVVVAGMTLPNPESDEEEESLLADSLKGFRWIAERKAMLKFLLVATCSNFFLAICEVVTQPYGLSFLGKREFGVANGMFGAGMIIGGLACGPLSKRFTNIQQFIGSALVVGIAYIAFGFSRDVYSFAAIDFTIAAMMTVCNASIMTIWQVKTPEALQGRVFSAMQMAADISTPISFLVAAPLADTLAPAVFAHTGAGSLWGSSETGEMGALFSMIGAIIFAGFVFVWTVRDVRTLEESVEDAPAEQPA
jgi:MFS family permease